MRADPMPAETAMRHILRATQFEDVKFARQRVIAPYIADFVARSRRLGVEIDGDTHAMRDVSRRTAWLERQGYGVIRFTNRSEEHTSELQSRENLVCRLLLEK